MIQEFKFKYKDNPLLYSSVGKMLEYEEKNRPDFFKLKEVLPDYETIKKYF